MKEYKVEILAPAGSYESMTAAVEAGADAVYIGGSRFGARAYADNLDTEKMLEAIDYVHLRGRKLYMTVNTLMKEEELSQLYDYLKPYYEHGLDAVIVQDMGTFSYMRKQFPDLPVHASTQMTITGVYGAKLLADLGAERIVTARELSLEEIREIHEKTDVEIESFVHGALCYSYSGQCLLSSLIGGRSGNRGRCAQPCRLPYEVKDGKGRNLNKKEERHVLCLKDLCTLDIIPDMIEAGVYSMKIEGRMKSPRYTAGVVSVYRKYVDLYLKNGRKGYKVDPADKRLLLDLFDRGGFTEGYYGQHNGKDMVALQEKPSFREGNQKLFEYLDETYVEKRTPISITGQVYLEEGQPAVMNVQAGEVSCSVTGAVVERALNQPVTEEKLRKQLSKTGGTAFSFSQLELFVQGQIFMPVQSLNELRRTALEQLEQEMLRGYRRKPCEQKSYEQKSCETCEENAADHVLDGRDKQAELELHVSLERSDCLEAVLSLDRVTEVAIDSTGFEPEQWKQTADNCHKAGKQCLLVLPHIFRTEAVRYFKAYESQLKEAGFDGLMIRSLEELGFLKEMGIELPLMFDAPVYLFNKEAGEMLTMLSASRITLPAELNSRELKKLGCHGHELMVYGRLPVMVSAQCIQRTTSGCTKKEQLLWIKDRMGKEFPVKNHCRFCYNTIYNSSPLSLAGQAQEVKQLNPGSIRLQFTTETPAEVGSIGSWYEQVFFGKASGDGPVKEFTRGHWKRGVE